MKFRSPTAALQFYIGLRMGDQIPVSRHDRERHVYDTALCVAADIGKIIESFAPNVQRSLINFVWGGIRTKFTATTLRLFRQKLADADYLRVSKDVRIKVAA